MARLRETFPLERGQLVALPGCRLGTWDPGPITSVMPFRGQEGALGFPFPAPGKICDHEGGQIVWSGRGQAMALGVNVASDAAATSDQSDGWSGFELSGALSMAVLARLCPADLRENALPPGQVMRSMLQHMAMILIRHDADTFRILVFRSMSDTALHDLGTAMKRVAAQNA